MAKLKAYDAALKKVIAQRNLAEQTGLESKSVLDDCEFKNLRLYEANLEMAERCRSEGIGELPWELEALSGLKRVQIERVIEEYQRMLKDLKLRSTRAPTEG